jgi:dTDP-4-dehydrorhamnose reductase
LQRYMTKKVLVLGANGMLGHTCFDFLNDLPEFETYGTWRKPSQGNLKTFDAMRDSIGELLKEVKPDWIVNCIGVIKQKIDETDVSSVAHTLQINEVFPRHLADAVTGTNSKVIQIATDCVFDGAVGKYYENATHNALDLYGKSKSLGEILQPEIMNLRVSIIGREISSSYSLVDWFLSHEFGAEVNGYINHLWNGITTMAFAKIAAGVMQSKEFSPGTFHVIPSDEVTKYQLLELLRKHFVRDDILIKQINAPIRVDRTLRTLNQDFNRILWQGAGYEKIPSIKELVEEFAVTR